MQYLTDQQTVGVAVGDINSDGRKDVVVTGCGCGFQVNTKIYVYLQQASGSLDPTPVVYLPQNSPGGVSIGDLTGDGRNDLLMRVGLGFEVVPQMPPAHSSHRSSIHPVSPKPRASAT